MGIFDYIILCGILAAFFAALHSWKKNGCSGCAGDCKSCGKKEKRKK